MKANARNRPPIAGLSQKSKTFNMSNIIPYNSEQLRYHLANNVQPYLNHTAIEAIVKICGKVNAGEMSLDDQIAPNMNEPCTVAEMIEDLKIY
jgi:hypothetical protein